MDKEEQKEADEDLRILQVLTEHEGDDDATTLHSELAALHYKKERLACELEDVRQQVVHKDNAIQRLERDADQLREKAARQSAIITSLKKRLQDTEEKERSSSNAHTRSDIALQSLQREHRMVTGKLADTETQLRTSNAEREAHEHSLKELTQKLRHTLGIDEVTSRDGEAIVQRLNQILQDNAKLRSQANSLSERLQVSDSECKGSRDALGRLTGEREALQRQVSSQILGNDRIRQEKEELESSKLLLEREVSALQETLQATSRALSNTNSDLSLLQTQSRQIKEESKLNEQLWKKHQADNQNFVDSVSNMLKDAGRQAESNETSIRESLRELLMDLKDKTTLLDALRNKVSGISEELQRQTETSESLSRQMRDLREDKCNADESARKLDGEVANLQVMRDQLLRNQNKFYEFLDELAQAMKMEEVSREGVGFELQSETLLARAEQLVRMETDKLAGKTSAVYQLQRRVKNLQEQIRKKEVHLDLLRRKVQILEEGVRSRGTLEEQRDDAITKMRRLLKTTERLEFQAGEANAHIRSLKAELADAAEFKIAALERGRQVEELQKRLSDMDLVRTKSTRKILMTKDQLRATTESLEQERMVNEQRTRMLRDELSDTKMALTETQRRLNQLLELRDSVSRTLGLEAPPTDIDLLSRLDKVVRARREYALVSRRYDDMRNSAIAGVSQPSGVTLQVPLSPSGHHGLLDDSGYLDPDDTFRDDVDTIYNRRPQKSPVPHV